MKKIILYITLYTLFTQYNLFAQWTLQNLPTTAQIYDIAFLNKDTGFVSVNSDQFLRTTNGGTNWNIITSFRIFQLEKIDSKTVYGINPAGNRLYRTFDGGHSFDTIPVGGWCSISFINKDTGWIGSLSGILKTTNGGLSVQLISTNVNCGNYINLLKQKYNNEYYGFHISSGFLNKTTNSGVNWMNINNGLSNVGRVFFFNKDTGWATSGFWSTHITTNGGSNWIFQFYDDNSGGEIYFINPKKGWQGGGFLHFFATTNEGLTWGRQNTPLPFANQLFFNDSLLGWSGESGIAKTTNGGGAITYIGIDSLITNIPISFILKQNYPNPFNPQTIILFSLAKNSVVSLTIYDISGKQILRLYNKTYLTVGNYKTVIDFAKLNVSSGVYLYTLRIEDNKSKELYQKTRKMSYVK